MITPTRDRPRGLSLLSRWLFRQDYDNFEWVVVDDGDEPFKPEFDSRLKYVRRIVRDTDPKITNGVNILRGCSESIGNFVIYLEDDDWVNVDFLSKFIENFESGVNSAVISGLRHYHVGRQKYQDKRMSPAEAFKVRKSLGCYMVRKDSPSYRIYIDSLRDCISREDPLIDIVFWKKIYSSGEISKTKFFRSDSIVLIKGIPGRAITRKHRDLSGQKDQDYKVLRNWVGTRDYRRIVAACSGWENWCGRWELENYK